jgi:hypothetical protein
MSEGSEWTSLEVAKLVVSGLTPIVVAFLTVAITRATKRAERRKKPPSGPSEQSRQSGQVEERLSDCLSCTREWPR